MKPPPKLSGSNPLVGWLNRLRDCVLANEITSVSNGRMEAGRGGTQIICGGKGGGGATASEYRLKSVQDDYVVARTWDGTNEGSTDIYIAKPYRLRISLTSEDGYSYTYGGSHPNKSRTKTLGGDSEVEYAIPRWVVNEVISAMPAQTSVTTIEGHGSKRVTLIMVDSTKAWAKQYE